MTKVELRRAMRPRLIMSDAERAARSLAIAAVVAAHPAYAAADRVALFSPLASEPDVELLWREGVHRFCYPRTGAQEMEFVEVPHPDHLGAAAWHPHIREPASDARIVESAEIALILVPGMAFTASGHRLGRGGGYYDRFLARLPGSAVKLGVCFARQLVDDLPFELHDQRVDAVVTENGLISL